MNELSTAQPYNRVLVTGGAGFIGRRVVARLAQQQVPVTVVDDGSAGTVLPAASQWVKPVDADIRDAGAMTQVFAEFQPEAVIHLAALHHIPTCEAQPYRAMEINILGTQQVLDQMAAHGVRHLVLASSAAVYDWVDAPLVEDATPIKATDVYSTCKIANEHQAAIWATKHGGRVALARIFNVIGHDDPNAHLIPDVVRQLLAGQHSIALGNTAPLRDYTHAEDTADGVLALLAHLQAGAAVEAYNIGSGAEYSVADLVHAIGDYLGRAITITHDPARVRPIDRLHLLASTQKMRQVTGWQAKLRFHQALAQVLMHVIPSPHAARHTG